jgi:hypothetical protein
VEKHGSESYFVIGDMQPTTGRLFRAGSVGTPQTTQMGDTWEKGSLSFAYFEAKKSRMFFATAPWCRSRSPPWV